MPLQAGRYNLHKCVGRAESYKVYQGADSVTGRRCAARAVRREDGASVPCELQREIAALNLLRHDHILCLEDVVTDRKALYLIHPPDVVDSRPLQDEIPAEGMPEPTARLLFQQLTLALVHCHRRGVAHGDLSVSNIRIAASGDLLLVGFDQATVLRGPAPRDRPGARSGAGLPPPEFLTDAVSTSETYDPRQSDCWALGEVLYCLVEGRPPFETTGALRDAMQRVESGRFLPLGPAASPAVEQLVGQLLEPMHDLRLTAPQALSAPWARAGLDPHAPAFSRRSNACGFRAWRACRLLLLARRRAVPQQPLWQLPADAVLCVGDFLQRHTQWEHAPPPQPPPARRPQPRPRRDRRRARPVAPAPVQQPAAAAQLRRWRQTQWGWQCDSDSSD